MIIDINKTVQREQPYWKELQKSLENLEAQPRVELSLEQAKRLHYLYERASASLAEIRTLSGQVQLREYLESMVARTYGIVHSLGRPAGRFSPTRWFFHTFPATFRVHYGAFLLSLAIMAVGTIFGAVAVAFDPSAKDVILPFEQLKGDPAERVRREEQEAASKEPTPHAAFASLLMANNIKVSFMTLALGMTWGIGTITLLFYNGVILGAVGFDYVQANQTRFLLGWLLPHGSIEIPAILLAGQAGLVLASALLGRGQRQSVKARLRQVTPDMATLILGVAVMLVWAAIVESFFSQYHEPMLPYAVKIAFGCLELALLALFLALSGRGGERGKETPS